MNITRIILLGVLNSIIYFSHSITTNSYKPDGNFGAILVRVCSTGDIKINHSVNPKYKVSYMQDNGLGKTPATKFNNVPENNIVNFGCAYSFVNASVVDDNNPVKSNNTIFGVLNTFKLNPIQFELQLGYRLNEYHLTKYSNIVFSVESMDVSNFMQADNTYVEPRDAIEIQNLRNNGVWNGAIVINHPRDISVEVINQLIDDGTDYTYQYMQFHAPTGFNQVFYPGVLTLNLRFQVNINDSEYNITPSPTIEEPYLFGRNIGNYFNKHLISYQPVRESIDKEDAKNGYSDNYYIQKPQVTRFNGDNNDSFYSYGYSLSGVDDFDGEKKYTYSLNYFICSYDIFGSTFEYPYNYQWRPFYTSIGRLDYNKNAFPMKTICNGGYQGNSMLTTKEEKK